MELYTIANTSRDNLIVKLYVLEFDSSEIGVGQEVILESDSFGNEEVKGIISKVAPTVTDKMIGSANKRVVEVDVKIEAGDMVIRAGSGVSAVITTSFNESAPTVPLMSIFNEEESDDYFIYTINDNFEIEKKEVKLGTYTGSNIEVIGVEVGDKIVIDPPTTLENGSKVKYSDLSLDKE